MRPVTCRWPLPILVMLAILALRTAPLAFRPIRATCSRRQVMGGFTGGALGLSGWGGRREPAVAEVWGSLGNGLQFFDFISGTGAEAREGLRVSIQWSGRLFSKQGLSYGRCADAECELRFRVGDGSTILGLDQGVRGMREGGVRRLIIPPPLAYQEGKLLQPLPESDDMKRRLYSTVFNKVRVANGEGDTLGTISLDVSLKRVRTG
ncbi:unnamed protein product [Polarella glacialis]|uniref:peptidylprolyl isomerase n=1 Tax=Polarella glacialis TaxID=89957 RepID=A0A813LSZ7_POLGL|nr:unnamed protein product [Polarella glacialis]